MWAGIWAWLRERIFSLALVFALAFLLLVSLVISAALASAAALFHGPEQALLSRVLELAVSLLVLTFVFALLFKYVPDAEIGWRDVWLGGLLTAALFTLGKTAIGVYLGQASVGSAYGAAGSMVVLLVWVYYSALILFFGAEFTQAWATRHGEVTPQPHAISGARPRPKARRPPTAPRGPERSRGSTLGDVLYDAPTGGARWKCAFPREHSPRRTSNQALGFDVFPSSPTTRCLRQQARPPWFSAQQHATMAGGVLDSGMRDATLQRGSS